MSHFYCGRRIVLLVSTKDLFFEVWRISRVEVEIQAALCTLSEERLKITLPPESKARLVLIRALNKYLETEELDYEKLKGLSSSLSMQGKEIAQEQKTAPPKAPENNNTTVKAEQKSAVSISKFKRDLKIWSQIGDVSQKDRLSFSSLVYQIENGLKRMIIQRMKLKKL